RAFQGAERHLCGDRAGPESGRLHQAGGYRVSDAGGGGSGAAHCHCHELDPHPQPQRRRAGGGPARPAEITLATPETTTAAPGRERPLSFLRQVQQVTGGRVGRSIFTLSVGAITVAVPSTTFLPS